jgi:hypothetical protein
MKLKPRSGPATTLGKYARTGRGRFPSNGAFAAWLGENDHKCGSVSGGLCGLTE